MNQYRDSDDLRANIEAFIESYNSRRRLHAALGYRPPEEFEQTANATTISDRATVSFSRHTYPNGQPPTSLARIPLLTERDDPASGKITEALVKLILGIRFIQPIGSGGAVDQHLGLAKAFDHETIPILHVGVFVNTATKVVSR